VIELLSKFELLSELGEHGRELLCDFLRERHLRAGQGVFRAGDEAEELLLLVEGQVRLSAQGESLGLVRPGSAIGGASLVTIGNRECDAIAENPVVLLVLSRESYLRLRSDAPDVALALQEGILRDFAGVVRGAVCESA
jgi:CRP-like cAMP-binding protein